MRARSNRDGALEIVRPGAEVMEFPVMAFVSSPLSFSLRSLLSPWPRACPISIMKRVAVPHPRRMRALGSSATIRASMRAWRTRRTPVDQLAQQWARFSPGDREHCERLAAWGEMPSYVELQTCLQIARETKTLPEPQSIIKKSRLPRSAEGAMVVRERFSNLSLRGGYPWGKALIGVGVSRL